MMFVNLLAIALLSSTTSASRILGVFPHGFPSHHRVAAALMEGLVARGHQVVVVSAFPRTSTLAGYTDVSLVGDVPAMTSDTPLDVYKAGEDRADLSIGYLFATGLETCDNVLSLPKIQALVQQTFNLVIYEVFNTDCFLGLVAKINAPYIAVSASAMMPWHYERFGNPDNPSYIPFHFLPHTDRMSYTERMKNALFLAVTKIVYHYKSYLPAVKATQRHLENIACLKDVGRNTSLLLLNTHFSLNLPRAQVPGIVEVGGIHIQPVEKLPQAIQTFLDGAEDGVIYFSFGSTVKASTFPAVKRRALVDAFSQLPQRVLWKWEGELPDRPDNVMTLDWMPQASILNHPNVRVFVTHGGLLGVMEAVAAGVPMVAVPLFGDQPLNVAALVQHGVAVRLDYPAITRDNVLRALDTVLHDTSYMENAKRLSLAFNDRPVAALELAVYWTEYVIRHQGAPLLRVASTELSWYQYYLLDVATPILGIALVTLLITWKLLAKCWNVGMAICAKRAHCRTNLRQKKKN